MPDASAVLGALVASTLVGSNIPMPCFLLNISLRLGFFGCEVLGVSTTVCTGGSGGLSFFGITIGRSSANGSGPSNTIGGGGCLVGGG